MEINDVIWLISNGFKYKEKILSGSSDLETRTIMNEMFRYEEMNDIKSYKETSISEIKVMKSIFTQMNKSFESSFRNSPHDFKLLICYIIDTMLLNYNILAGDADYPYYSHNTNKLMKLELFPDPYIRGYKIFLYIYRLKVICMEKLSYCEWSNLLSKLNLIVEKCEATKKISNHKSFDSFNDFLISDLGKIILTNKKSPKTFNMLQSSHVFGNLSKLSIFLKGINLLKTPEMKKLGEQYLIKTISIHSLTNINFDSFKFVGDKTNIIQSDQLFQIYCIISMSMNSNDFRNSIKYIICAERLLRNLSKSTSIGTVVLIKIYVLISKLYLLIYNLNAKYGRFCPSNSKFNKFDCLPYLIISTLELIHSEILENAKFLTKEEQNNILNHLSEYICYLRSDYPTLLTMKFVESYSSGEPSNSRYLCFNVDEHKKKSLNSIFPIYNIFSYLNTAENNVNYFFEVHSLICWTKLIPNFLLCYSEFNSKYYENMYNSIFLSQLADQLFYYVQILNISDSEFARTFPKVKAAELYLFISLYSYYAKDEISKVTEFLLYGSEILESCSDSFNVCSIKCIFAYINLLIHLRSSNDISNIESQLRKVIRNGKMVFKFIYSNQMGSIFKKKMVNLALIQSLTLLILIKNDLNALESDELDIHLRFEENETEIVEESYIENNVIISKYLSITRSLNNCI
ncbi:putative low complexity [Cryptosporidium sp. chipmunk genotype I]|uniref:putative low complexity n=1 Tax=Cryptosporidium sp. chipmunk genotype I TaxID=1280935 RepID=UPI00351A079A|nr:putative low complexity [Cryptosporidium sp. chipmunk genotype I]